MDSEYFREIKVTESKDRSRRYACQLCVWSFSDTFDEHAVFKCGNPSNQSHIADNEHCPFTDQGKLVKHVTEEGFSLVKDGVVWAEYKRLGRTMFSIPTNYFITDDEIDVLHSWCEQVLDDIRGG